MADGELTLKLDDDTLRRLAEAAGAAGQAVEAYAADLIGSRLAEDDFAEELARVAEFRRTGQSISVEEAMAHFDDELRKQRPGAS